MMKSIYPRILWGGMAFFCLLLIAPPGRAGTITDTTSITLHVDNQTLESTFKLIEKQTGLTFFYEKSMINGKDKITVNIEKGSLESVLRTILKGKGVKWETRNSAIIISKESATPASSNLIDTIPLIDISGKVLDTKGNPIEAATVSLKGQQRGQGTDRGGNFSFSRVPANGVLIFSSLGFDSKTIKINGRNFIQATLDSSIREIEAVEVVSTGYQKLPKERATGSFVQVNNKVYNEQVGVNVLERLPSIASSVQVLPAKQSFNSFALTIRGISTVNGPSSPLVVVDNFPFEGNINNINPNDVDNITILRDAAASSIWGTRAGNGVIVITTKKGSFNRKTSLTFTSNLTISEKPDLTYIKSISTSDFIDVEKQLFESGHYDLYLQYLPFYFQTKVVDILEKVRNNQISKAEGDQLINSLRNNDIKNEYQKYIYQNAVNQQYALNLSGGSNNFAWIIGGSYDQNKGELQEGFKRYNFNIDNTIKPIKNLSLNFGLTYSQTESISGANGYNSLPGLNAPYTLFKDGNSSPVPFFTFRESFVDTVGQGLLLDWRYYPSEDYKFSKTTTDIQNLRGRFNLKYSLPKIFSFEINYQLEKQASRSERLDDVQSFYTRDLINRFSQIDYSTGIVDRAVPLGAVLNRANGNLTSQRIRGQVNVDHNFENSSLSGIVGGEISDIKIENINNTLFGYNSDLKTHVPIDVTKEYPQVIPDLGTGFIAYDNLNTLNKNRSVSLFSNFIYTYLQKYSVSASYRRDASNLFGVESNKKWNPLWSVGASWNISNESFFTSTLLPLLKLRSTYGVSGNVLPNATAVTTIGYYTPSVYTNTPRAFPFNYANSDLSWEKVRMLNIGLDFGFKGNRIGGSIDYFRRKSVDLYSNTDYDRTLGIGTSFLVTNNGKMKGEGIDLILNTINIKRNVIWATNINLSFYKDKVVEFYSKDLVARDYVATLSGAKGYPRYPVLSYKFAGLDPENGDPIGYIKGKESKNYYAILTDSTDLQELDYHGSTRPKFYGSMGNTVSYKNFSFTIRMSYEFGHYFVRSGINYEKLVNSGQGHSDFSNRWKSPGDENNTSIPSFVYPVNSARENFYRLSSALVSKADNIRIDYVNLSYNLPIKNVVNSTIKNLKVALIANKVGLVWKANKYGIDPFYSGEFEVPAPRNYTISFTATL